MIDGAAARGSNGMFGKSMALALAASASLLIGPRGWAHDTEPPLPPPPTDPLSLKHWNRLQKQLDYLYEENMSAPEEHYTSCLEDDYDIASYAISDLELAIEDNKEIDNPTAADDDRLAWLENELTYVHNRRDAVHDELDDRHACPFGGSYLEGFYGYSATNGFQTNSYGVQVAVAERIQAYLPVQLDGGYVGRLSFGSTTGVWNVDGQAGYLAGGGNYFGGLIGATGTPDSTLVGGFADYSHYFANVTLNTMAGYARESPSSTDIWGGRAIVRYYPYPNLSLNATGAGFSTTSHFIGSSFTDTYFDAGVGAEGKIPNTPVSIFVDYDHVWTNPGNFQTDVVRAGLRLTYGGSVQGRDEFGAGRPSLVRILGAPFGQ